MKSEKILLIIAIIFIIVGTGIFLYPSISNYFAEKNHVEAIRNYDKMVVKIGEDSLKKEKEKAQTYNENLSGDPVHDPFVLGSGYALPENYKEVLNISGDGIMGYIQIPKISVDLPIYHGTSGEDLVTLVTCTPYGVNSHRLLVKAKRVEYEDYTENNNSGNTIETSNNSNTINNVETKKTNKQYYLTGIQIGTVILIIVLITTLIVGIIIKRSKKSDE